MVFNRPAVTIGTPTPSTLGLGQQIINYLSPRVENIILQDGMSALILDSAKHSNIVELPLESSDADLVIAVGGDGTILRVAREVGSVPILPVNRGRRGFLAEVEPLDLEQHLEMALQGKFILEKHRRLEAEAGDQKLPSVLNEYLITSSELLRVIDITTSIDGVTLDPIRGDGIIISTPAGSTGHALSAGGAVLAAPLPAIVLALICPLNLMMGTKSIIVSDLSQISVHVVARNDCVKVVADGQPVMEKEQEMTINIRSGDTVTQFVRFHLPVHRLKGKLSL